ncbi:hypothetical protein ACHAW6_008152 [Cyclotella cf. meneghiniana]
MAMWALIKTAHIQMVLMMTLSPFGRLSTLAFHANVMISCPNVVYVSPSRSTACAPPKTNAAFRNVNQEESIYLTSYFTRLQMSQEEKITLCSQSLQKYYHIEQAKYSQLPQVAEIITHSFHPELDNNPILRPLRVLFEMDRLQSNFPYGDEDHYYFVVSCGSGTDKDEIVVGFCDLDFRSPPTYSTYPFTMFSSSSSNHIIRQRPYLSDVAIHPEHRRRGLASSLMAEVENRARSRGVKEIYLGVAEENRGALKMYDGMGYEVLDYFQVSVGVEGFGSSVKLLRLEL